MELKKVFQQLVREEGNGLKNSGDILETAKKLHKVATNSGFRIIQNVDGLATHLARISNRQNDY